MPLSHPYSTSATSLLHILSQEEEEEGFYMLRPVNKTDHMQQGISVLA